MFTFAACEPAHNNSCGPVLKEKSGHPWLRQNRVTNATPQSKTSNISKCLLTRLKSYRCCPNHTHKILSLHARISRAAISPTEPRLSYSKYTNCLNLDFTLQPKVPEEEQNTQPAHHVFGFPFLQYQSLWRLTLTPSFAFLGEGRSVASKGTEQLGNMLSETATSGLDYDWRTRSSEA
jgi:hypothetical protein